MILGNNAPATIELGGHRKKKKKTIKPKMRRLRIKPIINKKQ